MTTSTQNLCQPGVAFGLGWIPGVGAIYNGEYLKAFVHVMIFGFLISVSDTVGVGIFEPLFNMLTAAFYLYMPVEAYHIAKRKKLEAEGLLVSKSLAVTKRDNLWAGVILTCMGLVLFLNNLVPGVMEEILRLWPIVLIAFGLFKIYEHFSGGRISEEER